MNARSQLPLALAPPPHPSFENYIAGPNGSVVATLRDGLETGSWTLLKGPAGHGRSHLLTAAFHHHQRMGCDCAYLPLSQSAVWALLPTTEAALVVVDDVDQVSGVADAERALFNALNEWRAAGTTVLMSATSLDEIMLPDLRSRLGQATRLTLKPLSEDDLLTLVQQWVDAYEAVLSPGAASYLVSRTERAPAALSRLVSALAQQALAERRSLSIPLIRSHFQREGEN